MDRNSLYGNTVNSQHWHSIKGWSVGKYFFIYVKIEDQDGSYRHTNILLMRISKRAKDIVR